MILSFDELCYIIVVDAEQSEDPLLAAEKICARFDSMFSLVPSQLLRKKNVSTSSVNTGKKASKSKRRKNSRILG